MITAGKIFYLKNFIIPCELESSHGYARCSKNKLEIFN